MSEPIPVYIGLDRRETVAWHVCAQSILDNASDPDRIQLHAVTGKQRDGSNAFTYARFLVPWRQRFNGHALWMDGDMLVRGDLVELWGLRQNGYMGVQVVKHDYLTKHPVKYLGQRNEDYPRKNWSSVVLWNCAYFPNRVLTPSFVERAPGSFLHQFRWLRDEQIGTLPQSWNRLVLEQPLQPDDNLRHFTIGSPCFKDYADCDGADEWHETYRRMIAPYEYRHLYEPQDRVGKLVLQSV